MKTLFIDIETRPGTPDYNKIKPDARLKDEEKIRLDLEEKKKDAEKGTLLKSCRGFIYCITVALDEGEIVTFAHPSDEKSVIEQLNEYVRVNQLSYDDVIVGHNFKSFDLPWLLQRSMKYQQHYLFHFLQSFDRYSKNLFDTMERFNFTAYKELTSQSDVAYFFGIPVTDEIKGGDVYECFLAGEYDKIIHHNHEDVRVLREIYKRMKL